MIAVMQPPEIALEQAELFRALDAATLERLRPQLRERPLYRRRQLFREGEPAAALWVARRGVVRLYRASEGGRTTTLERLAPGEVFGALSALEEERYPASAEALEAGVAWCLPRAALLRLLDEDPHAGVELLRIVSARLRDAHARLLSFATDRAPARLAHALLGAAQGGEARLTRRELAEAAGTTVETAIRVLRRLEREGIVRGEVGLLAVLDEDALRRLAGGA
jgi:CRP-like cAMP-binding protein